MTEEEYSAYVGKLCHDMDKKNHMYMIYDMYWKLNHKGSMFLAYRYIAMPTGHMGEAPCSYFFGAAAYVKWLTPDS